MLIAWRAYPGTPPFAACSDDASIFVSSGLKNLLHLDNVDAGIEQQGL
jgi:hypothetical protein